MPLHYSRVTISACVPGAPTNGTRASKGNMTRGFALVAHPKYGLSGVMTFVVTESCIVHRKDFRANIFMTATAMTTSRRDTTGHKRGE